MVNGKIIDRLFGLLSQYVGELKDQRSVSWKTFAKDVKTKRFVERTLQMCIEVCLDAGNHIIADEGWKEAETNRVVFIRLKEKGVITDSLLEKLLKMAGFRNRVVHDYADVEPEIVYGILKEHVEDFDSYISEVLKWMEIDDI